MEVGWLIANVTYVGSPARTERHFLGDFRCSLANSQASLVGGKSFCNV